MVGVNWIYLLFLQIGGIDGIPIAANYMEPGGAYKITFESKFVEIETKCGTALFDGDRKGKILIPTVLGKATPGLCQRCDIPSSELCNGTRVSGMPKKARWNAIGESCLVDFPGYVDEE